MLAIISKAREQVLANPRLDMPRGEVFAIAGRHRNIYPVRLPKEPPQITAEQIPGGEVAVRWGLTTHTWGLFANVYRGREPDFALSPETKIARTELGAFIDRSALPSRDHYYAVVFDNEKERSEPVRVSVKVSFASKLDKRITKSRGKQTQVAGGS
jgi:hypothetical protein